jgi:glucose-1-phosphate cytidylyltransferase
MNSSMTNTASNLLENARVIVLCGGRGSRLRPLTDEIPKAMTPVHGRPMIDHIIDFYHRNGLNEVTVCTGYKAKVIEDHLARHAPNGMNICFANAGEGASMLQRLTAAGIDRPGTTIVSYGDTFINLDVKALLRRHREAAGELTLVSAKIVNPFGLIQYGPDMAITSFQEKPVLKYYVGCFTADGSAFRFMTDDMLNAPDGEGLVAFLRELVNQHSLTAFEHDGLHITFNTIPEMDNANREMEHFYTLQEKI